MQARESAKNALESVLEAVPGESTVIVCDQEKRELGEAFAQGALNLGLWTRLMILETGNEMRHEPPPQLLEVLTSQKPNIFVNLMRGFREETPFRIEIIKYETRDHRARLGHCPGVSIDMLTEGAMALTLEEHRKMQGFAERVIDVLEGTVEIELTSVSGSRISMGVRGRPFFTDTKLDWKTLKWMNLPTGEVIVAPVESSLSGRLVCDLAIGGVKPLRMPLELIAKNGKVIKLNSKDKDVLRAVKETLATDEWSQVVGEFAFGINPKARLVEEFLEAEKVLGTVHIAFGNNTDMPEGRNPSKNHMDFLISKPTVRATKEGGKHQTILKNGLFKI